MMQQTPCSIRSFTLSSGLASIILTVLFFWTILPGQSTVRIKGFVIDGENGEPVEGAMVTVLNTPFIATTGEGGSFTIENIPEGICRLRIKHLGYRTQEIGPITVSGEQTKSLTIRLDHQPIETDSILIVSDLPDRTAGSDGAKIVLNSENISFYKNLGMSELLQQVGGIQVESTGSGTNNVFIRIHGGSSSQVLVLLDGQRLNNPQTGSVDLGMIPIKSLQEIEIIRQGNTAIFGNNAFDGIIHFKTRKIDKAQSVSIGTSVGSFSSTAGEVIMDANLSRLQITGNYHQDYSSNHFQYPHEGENYTRENAWTRSRRVFGKVNFTSSRNSFDLLMNLHKNEFGLPSAFYEEMLHHGARALVQFVTMQLNHEWYAGPDLYVRNLIGYNAADQFFNNENDPSGFTRYKTEQINRTYEFKSDIFYEPHQDVQFRSGISYLQEQLNGKNLLYSESSIGKKSRETYSVFAAADWKLSILKTLLKASSLRVAVRYERYFNLRGSFYPYAGISLVPKFLPFFSVSGSWAKVIRYPDFNSLFWKGDARSSGNPELLPERKEQWNLGVRLKFPGDYSPVLNTYFYSEKIEDLIFWHRNVQGIWEPRNEEKTSRRGIDLQLNQAVWKERVQWQISYSYIDARNKSDEPNRSDKRIVFIPEHTVSSSMTLRYNPLQLIVAYRYGSQRYVTAANTGTPLDPYEIWDLSIIYGWTLSDFQLEFSTAFKNITERRYELIRGYPMPGRQVQLSVAVKYNSF
ncbi:MAG: TonB-dependent receptor [Calditrichaeota bacterium]|nr:TonB-dependent receptor [Calditrichota bacterium]RQW01590.1 MAG: TonB-dependent receptor [Calditrichota bacterium]